jgi:hypothetical protein
MGFVASTLRRCLAPLLLVLACARPLPTTSEAGTAVYVRTDSNATTIVTPRVSASTTIDERATIAASYTVDAWTAASIDIVTAATKPVSEVRHQLDARGGWRGRDLALDISYRTSLEPDYRSHGGVLRGALELDEDRTTLALTLFGGHDRVGRAGDPFFRQPQWNLGARLTLAQVLGRRTLGELGFESTRIAGFQASPYRFVAIGGPGTCFAGAPYCVPEAAPELRWRQAAFGRVRRAFGDSLSLGLEYRHYFDSWGIHADTLRPDLAWLPSPLDTLMLDYRFHTQGQADFYRPRYLDFDATDYVTRDRKLSAMLTHELGLGYLHEFRLPRAQPGRLIVVKGSVRMTGTLLRYLAFVGLERVFALATSVSLSLEFR